MQLHPGLTVSAIPSRCRTLVGGFGFPGLRDLDFGEKFIRYAQAMEWPDGVIFEDLSYSAHLVLHRLQELRPAKLVLVGAVSRGGDPPGTIRRYRLDLAPPPPQDVHDHLTEAIGGEVGLDHTLAVARHWGGLPHETIVVEIEAADSSFGLGFSEAMAGAMDPLLEIVRNELGDQESTGLQESAPLLARDGVASGDPTPPSPGGAGAVAVAAAPSNIAQLFEYADAHCQLRALEAFQHALPAIDGLTFSARFLPAGRALRTTGNWYDVIPLDTGVGLAIGHVVADGLEAASEVAQLKATLRAFTLLQGNRPGRLIELLDRLVATSGIGVESTFLYASVDPLSGEVSFSNAAHCPPLLLVPGRRPEFLESARSRPLGIMRDHGKPETAVRLLPGSTLLLFTAGLVASSQRSMRRGLQQLEDAVVNGPTDLEKLCDYVLKVCLPEKRESDVSLLAMRLDP